MEVGHPVIVTFVVPGVPQTKGSWTVQPKRGGGVRLAPGQTAAARDRYEGWVQDVQVFARQAMGMRDPMAGPVQAEIAFVLPRPKTVTRRWPTARSGGDLDKLERAVYDAVTGIVLADDSIVVAHSNLKRYAESTEEPHASCTFTEIGR